MTTIIAVKNSKTGKVDIAWDSQVSPQGGNVPKVVHVNNQFYFGTAGHLRYLDILQYAQVDEVHPAEYGAEEFDARGYIITEVVPAWIKALKKNNEDVPDSKEDWPWGVGILVIRGRIFQVGADFSVQEMETMAGSGSGADYALGALAAGKGIEKAMEIAAGLDLFTGGTITVLKGA